MPKIIIKGTFVAGGKTDVSSLTIEGDCQTCGGSFDITIPYDLDAEGGTVQQLHSKASADDAGQRTIKAK